MRREGGVRAWPPSPRQQGVPQAAVPGGWLSGAARSARQKLITVIFPAVLFHGAPAGPV